MKPRIRAFTAGLALLLAMTAPAVAASETFVFDKSHSKVGFQIRPGCRRWKVVSRTSTDGS